MPGLFDPLVVSNLYPDRTVRLVDGGVYDNQGVTGLLNEGCSIVFCSDASGQMEDALQPPGGLLGPLNRSSQAIFMDRIREAQFQDLQARVDASALSGLFFIHLKQDLPSLPIAWVGCQDPPPPPLGRNTTNYNIDFTLQQQIAAVRTDLDSFTEVEAYTLMLSGYLMTDRQCRQLQEEHAKTGASTQWGDFKIDAAREEWPFLQLEEIAAKVPEDPDPRRRDLGTQLAASQSLFFKAWQVCPEIHRSVRDVASVLGFLWLASQGFSPTRILAQVGTLLVALLAIAGAAGALAAWNFIFPKRAVHNYVGKGASMIPAWVLAQLHLRFFDRAYLERGRLSALLALGSPPGTDAATVANTPPLSPSGGPMNKAKIFISYAHEDQAAVTRIVTALKDIDLDVWVDAQSLAPGQNWIAEIDRALSDAGYLLAVVSQASIKSQWMQREWTAMLSRQLGGTGGGVVIPLRLEDVQVPALLQPIQRMDLFPDFEKGLATLVGFLLSETRPAWLVQQQQRGGKTATEIANDQLLRAPAPHGVAYGPTGGVYPAEIWRAWHAALKHEQITDPVLEKLDKRTIRRIALHCVTEQDLQSFCFDAGISYGGLSGANLNERIIALLVLLIRDDRLAEFLKWLADESPRCVEVAIRKYMREVIPPGL